MCTAGPPARSDLDALLERFIAGDKLAREQLPRAARPYLLKLARRLAPDLPDDIQEEGVNQSFLNLLLQKPGSYDPARGIGKTFLKFMLRIALRQVRASYALPGHMTRLRRQKRSTSLPAVVPYVASLDDLDEADMPTIDGGIAATEARHDVLAILRCAPARVAATVERVYVQEHLLNDVANDLGVSRYTLSRQIREFTRNVRASSRHISAWI